MHTKSFSLIAKELKQIKILEKSVSRSFDLVRSYSGVTEMSKADRSLFNDSRIDKSNETLRELMFVRTISALESFLVESIKEVFVSTKLPFIDSTDVVFKKGEILSATGITKIFQKIIDKEVRSVSGGGFLEFAKFYRKKFSIDFSKINPGINKMAMYHEIRNLIVHRLGNTDSIYRRKYRTSKMRIALDKQFFDDFVCDLEFFSKTVSGQIISFMETSLEKKKEVTSKLVVDLEFLCGAPPAFLEKNHEFWVDDEYVLVSDILQRVDTSPDGKARYHFYGSDRSMLFMYRFLKGEQRGRRLLLEEVSLKFPFEERVKRIPEDVVKAVTAKMPKQPWPRGMHKKIACELSLSNKDVSSAIAILISRGVFKNQRDGVILD